MANQRSAATNVQDAGTGQRESPNMPNLKVAVGKLSAIPGLSKLKDFHVRMLRVHMELLKGQNAIIEQVIQGLEAIPSSKAPEDASPEKRKIVVS